MNWYLADCYFVAILGCSYLSGGLASPVTPWFTLVPICAVLLLGWCVDVLAWFAVSLAVPLAYGWRSSQALPSPRATTCSTGRF